MMKWFWAVLMIGVTAGCVLIGPSGGGVPSGLLLELRFLRVATAFTVGAALALSGVVLQAVLRNPLAEPYVLGVSSGAGLGAVLAIVAGIFVPGGAVAGAGLALGAVWMAGARGEREFSVYRLILCGTVTAAMFSSILMMTVSLSSARVLQSVTWWMMGNLSLPDRELLLTAAVTLTVGTGLLLVNARALDALSLGEETAHNLGYNTRRLIPFLLICATVLTAAAVAVAGLIGFIGLIIPHVVRKFAGCGHRGLVPLSVFFGGAFLAVCDTAARTVWAPVEIPAGVVTALCGGPFFIWILNKRT